jgi:hypothetical protein|tara:strand:- start:1240 stop:1386 length:147 start_codon:yes stop_codon:yes gene_type:complete
MRNLAAPLAESVLDMPGDKYKRQRRKKARRQRKKKRCTKARGCYNPGR